MEDRVAQMIERFGRGDRRALARVITWVENGRPEGYEAFDALYPRSGQARIIGVTGPPGTGKSTLVDKLVLHLREDGRRVGVVAVDPSSPFSGGAILGDRIRMGKLAGDEGIFIRSMGTRGALGGLARTTLDVALMMDAFGMDVVVVETVGVGQSEVAIVKTADTSIVVEVPGLGASIQAIKAGVLEIGDLFVVNKADRDGSDRLQAEVETILRMARPHEDTAERLVPTVATTGQGVADRMFSFFSNRIGIKIGADLVCTDKTDTPLQLELTVDNAPFETVEEEEGKYRGAFSLKHPVTRGFDQSLLFQSVRSVSIAETAPEGVAAEELLRTTPDFWAESDIEKLLQTRQAKRDDGRAARGQSEKPQRTHRRARGHRRGRRFRGQRQHYRSGPPEFSAQHLRLAV